MPTSKRRLRLMIWLAAGGFLFFGQLAWLLLLRGRNLLERDDILIGGQIALSSAVLILAILLRTTPADSIRLNPRASRWIILLGTAALQAAAVALLWPALSADVVRYRLDGRIWLSGQSPYATAPNDFKPSDSIDLLVPYPNERTIYPGADEMLFATGAWIERAVMPPAHEVESRHTLIEHSAWRDYLRSTPAPWRAVVFRAIIAIVLVLAAAALLRLLHITGRSPWWAVLLAWNPLTTLEIGGMGHVDALGVLMVMLALLALAKDRAGRCGAWLAFATAVKPVAIVVLPFAMRHKEGTFRIFMNSEFRQATGRRIFWISPFCWSMLAAFAITIALMAVVPMLYQHGFAGWWQTAQIYAHSWEANGSIYNWITHTFGQGDQGRAMARAKEMARLLAAAGVLACGIIAWRAGASAAEAGYALCLSALLLAPVAYPWYLLWALVFVPLLDGRAGWSAIVWSGTISISYLLWRSGDWQLSRAAMLSQYIPVYAAVAFELAFALRKRANFRSEIIAD